MGTFREFEHTGWEDPATCAGYHDHLGPVVGQAVEPLLDAAQVATDLDAALDRALRRAANSASSAVVGA